MENAARMKTFSASDGNKIAYCIDDFTDPWQPSTPLILLHSAMANSQRFYAWVPKFSRHYQTIRMDIRGHGQSAVPPEDPLLTMDRLVRDVAEMMDHLTAFIGRFIGLMSTLDWSDRLSEIRCPTLIVMPGAETVGGTDNYDVMRARIPDVEFLSYEGLPHNICDAVPDRCADDVLAFLGRRFND
jgi:pimeloyl-ACP methyl ester carboxylesterase